MIQLSQTLKLEFLKNPSLTLDKNFTRPVSDTTDHCQIGDISGKSEQHIWIFWKVMSSFDEHHEVTKSDQYQYLSNNR